jgi:hypothetical protein
LSLYEGGERRLDVMKFIAIAHTLGADPVKPLATLLNGGGKRKSSGTSRKVPSKRST